MFLFKLDRNGAATIEEKVNIIKELPSWLELPVKWWLHVEAYVIERATGKKETAVDKSCLFTSSPYLVEFKNTPKYFKPGLPFVVKVHAVFIEAQTAHGWKYSVCNKGNRWFKNSTRHNY